MIDFRNIRLREGPFQIGNTGIELPNCRLIYGYELWLRFMSCIKASYDFEKHYERVKIQEVIFPEPIDVHSIGNAKIMVCRYDNSNISLIDWDRNPYIEVVFINAYPR